MIDRDPRRESSERPPTPWWVKAIGLALLVGVILVALVLAVGGGRHGPGVHGSAGTNLGTSMTAAPLVATAANVDG